MIPPLATSTIWYAFETSDWFSRLIVIVLFLVSIHTWTVMVDKGNAIRRARQGCRQFLLSFQSASNPLILINQLDRHGGPHLEVFKAGMDELSRILKTDFLGLEEYCRRRSFPRELTPYEIDKVRSTLERTVTAKILELEERVGHLGSAVTLSPFLGLLGTVWGIMLAFVVMAQKGQADLTSMAPGIAGALLTTVVGLVVAIPAVIGYNYLTSTIHRITVEMDTLVEDLVTAVRMHSVQM